MHRTAAQQGGGRCVCVSGSFFAGWGGGGGVAALDVYGYFCLGITFCGKISLSERFPLQPLGVNNAFTCYDVRNALTQPEPLQTKVMHVISRLFTLKLMSECYVRYRQDERSRETTVSPWSPE